MSDEAFNHSQLLQSLTSAAVQDQLQQNPANNQSDTHDSLIALATALRSTANASPLPAQSSIRQLNALSSSAARNHFAANNNQSLLNGKLLSPNISDLDNLTISSNSRPLRPPDSKGKYRNISFAPPKTNGSRFRSAFINKRLRSTLTCASRSTRGGRRLIYYL